MASPVLHRHHVSVLGEGPRVIVLAHGFGCDQRVWRAVVPELAQDHRVVRGAVSLISLLGNLLATVGWMPMRGTSLS